MERDHDFGPEDFRGAVRELASVYEELALLYRVSGKFSGQEVSEICGVLLDEALNVISVEVGAVLVSDHQKRGLVPRAVIGPWGTQPEDFPLDHPLLKPALEDGRLLAIPDVGSTRYGGLITGARGLIAVPLQGNARVVGLLVLIDTAGREMYYSNETKLLSALGYQAGLSIENALLLEENRSIMIGSFRALIKTLEASSKWTAGHSGRVAEYSRRIGEAMEMKRDFVDQLVISATLHDLGKVAVPDGILNQSDGLNSRQRELVDDHPTRGAAILAEIAPLAPVVAGIRHHHERWDGKGYPEGLAGEQIPIMARIIGVADAFDAMTTDRPYRCQITPETAVEELYNEAGVQFDPAIVAVFTGLYGTATR